MIKCKDFAPRITERVPFGGASDYESFSEVVSAVNQWIESRTIQVINFWRETTSRFYRKRNSVVILPWLVIGVNIVWMLWDVQSQNWTMEAILRAFSRLLVVLLFAEIIVVTWQVNSEH